MKLATLAQGGPDGMLVVVSADGTRILPVGPSAPTMLAAIENWTVVAPQLHAIATALEEGAGTAVTPEAFAAPLPRTWQWLDGSAFASHGALMEKAFNIAPVETDRPLMYQGMSHQFLSATADVPLPDEAHGIDFEGEFGVITDFVPMGVSAAEAITHVKLICQINDWSLRALAPAEMKTGFGWILAKPACSVAPFAVTPDELGEGWRDGRVCLDLAVDRNGERFGKANGGEMAYGFHELIAHAASTRALAAGTIIGSGTVSNENYDEVGSSCIAERRGIEIIAHGAPVTPFMRFGDRVRMEARTPAGTLLFGTIDQAVIFHR